MKKVTVGILLLFLASFAWAQEGDKFGEGKVIKAEVPQKDSAQNPIIPAILLPLKPQAAEAGGDVGKEWDGSFPLYRPLTKAHKDTLSNTLGELKIVEVSEELKIDSVWIKAAEYYSIWDSKNINPYQEDASLFRDTIDITLYNPDQGELWSAPLSNTLQTSGFGYRWGRFHAAIDLNLRIGTPVFTVFDGIVRMSAFNRGYGNYVVIRHRNGLETVYAHLQARKVEVGQVLKAGQLIGLGGSTGWSTGPHLHFEVRYAGNSFNPLLIYDFSKEEQLITDRFQLMPQHFWHLGNRIRTKITHKVVPGETLSIISAKYNVPVLTLARINRISVNSVLKVGQTLIIK